MRAVVAEDLLREPQRYRENMQLLNLPNGGFEPMMLLDYHLVMWKQPLSHKWACVLCSQLHPTAVGCTSLCMLLFPDFVMVDLYEQKGSTQLTVDNKEIHY